MDSYYSESELQLIGFKTIGKNVLISRKASIYGANSMCIGNNVRVDDFCILSGKITLMNYIHIAPFCGLYGGKAGIIMKDFTGISSRGAIYAATDDYSGLAITNPTVPDEFRNVISGEVVLEKHVILGTGVTVLPNIIIGEGSAVGSMSLVNKSLEEWGVYVGVPCKKIRERNKDLLCLEEKINHCANFSAVDSAEFKDGKTK